MQLFIFTSLAWAIEGARAQPDGGMLQASATSASGADDDGPALSGVRGGSDHDDYTSARNIAFHGHHQHGEASTKAAVSGLDGMARTVYAQVSGDGAVGGRVKHRGRGGDVLSEDSSGVRSSPDDQQVSFVEAAGQATFEEAAAATPAGRRRAGPLFGDNLLQLDAVAEGEAAVEHEVVEAEAAAEGAGASKPAPEHGLQQHEEQQASGLDLPVPAALVEARSADTARRRLPAGWKRPPRMGDDEEALLEEEAEDLSQRRRLPVGWKRPPREDVVEKEEAPEDALLEEEADADSSLRRRLPAGWKRPPREKADSSSDDDAVGDDNEDALLEEDDGGEEALLEEKAEEAEDLSQRRRMPAGWKRPPRAEEIM